MFMKQEEESTDRSKIGNHDPLQSDPRAVIGLTLAGVKVGSCPKRFPENTMWSKDGWLELRGFPFELESRHRDMPDSLADEAAPSLAFQRPEVFRGQAAPNFHVIKSDTAKNGATPGCKACSFVSRGATSSVQLSDECRQRIMETLGADDLHLETVHLELLRRQSANTRCYLCDKFLETGSELPNEIFGKKVVHGPLRSIDLGSIDSKRFVCKRIRCCTKSHRMAKAWTAWSSQMLCCTSENVRYPLKNQIYFGSDRRGFVENAQSASWT